MVEVLSIIIDRRPKGRLRKMENYTIEKIGCVPILIKCEYLNPLSPLSIGDRLKRKLL